MDLIPDQRVVDALEDLRDTVDNINKMPVLSNSGGIFKAFDRLQVQTKEVDGFIFGYKLDDLGNYILQRRVFIMSPGEVIADIPEDTMDPILLAVYNVFVTIGEGPVNMFDCTSGLNLKKDTLLITQMIMPMFLVERNPNLLVPGGKC